MLSDEYLACPRASSEVQASDRRSGLRTVGIHQANVRNVSEAKSLIGPDTSLTSRV
jgi:hypothetical protein